LDEHPIQGLMKTVMENIKEMIDVNTIVGDAVESPDGIVIIPISRVSFGFAAGGGEYDTSYKQDKPNKDNKMSFGGGSGAGVKLHPVAFMVVGQGQIRLLSITDNSLVDRIIDVAPQIIDKIDQMLNKKIKTKNNTES